MSDLSNDTPGVVAPPPVIYSIALGLALILHRIVPLPVMPGARRRSRRRLGFLMIVAGILPAAWAALTMTRQGNNPDPSHPVVSLVVDGPFRFSRNPIYLALTVSYLGIGLLIGTLWHVILLPVLLTVMRRGVVAREEAYLARRFGHQYHTYATRVRRWL